MRYLLTSFLISLLLLSCRGNEDKPVDIIADWENAKPQLLEEASEKSVQELVDQLESDDAKLRMAALITLRDMDPGETFEIALNGFDEDHGNIYSYWPGLMNS